MGYLISLIKRKAIYFRGIGNNSELEVLQNSNKIRFLVASNIFEGFPNHDSYRCCSGMSISK